MIDSKKGQSGKVLVVEDVALIRLTTMEMVELVGFAVEGAADGPQALQLLKADDGIGILLTDLGLPGMTGRQLTEEALKMRPSLRVIIATGYSPRENPVPNATYLLKPFDMRKLSSVLLGE